MKNYRILLLSALAVLGVVAEQTVPETFEEMVPMPDGVKLYTYGVRPAPGVKCPIVIMRNPYVPEKRVDLATFARAQTGNLARGYAYVIQHCRGCGMSEGDWIPYESERADGLALLEWVRKRPWYNGEIFLEGGSYLSSVHWSYLGTNPPDVKGACLAIQEVNRYNVAYRNGFFKAGLHGGWFAKGYKKKNHALQRDKSVSFADFPILDFSKRYWGEAVPALDNKLAHPNADDPFWRSSAPGSGVDYRRALLDSTMPILLRTAFYDIYTEGLNDMWRETPPASSPAVRAPTRTSRPSTGLIIAARDVPARTPRRDASATTPSGRTAGSRRKPSRTARAESTCRLARARARGPTTPSAPFPISPARAASASVACAASRNRTFATTSSRTSCRPSRNDSTCADACARAWPSRATARIRVSTRA